MGLEIANIQNLELQKMASKVDKKGNNNNKIDNDEIGKLLIRMTKNKYEFQDFKNLLGNDFENLSNEEKLNIYQNCYNELKGAMQLAESFAKDGDDTNCCFGNEVLKLIGASAFIGGASQIKPQAPTSIREVAMYLAAEAYPGQWSVPARSLSIVLGIPITRHS